MKSLFRLAREVAVLGQLGFTLITPPVLMALLGWWITDRFGLGVWVMVLAIVLGLVTSAASAWRLWKHYQASNAKKADAEKETDRPVVYYRHE